MQFLGITSPCNHNLYPVAKPCVKQNHHIVVSYLR
jgi:hypothetical protein